MEIPAGRPIAYLLFGIALLAGCRDGATPIPNSVIDEEYSVYSAWLKQNFKAEPPRLLLANRTFVFDPLGLGPTSCGKELESQAHVSSSLLRALHNLGDAEYLVYVGKFQLPAFRIPWKYEEGDRQSMDTSGPVQLISFSRVAFNRDRSQALFAVSKSCGGLCGGGGTLLATRDKGGWVFRPVGCVWTY